MNTTHNNISQDEAKKQMNQDRDKILKGAVAQIAKENGVATSKVRVIEHTLHKRNWYGKIVSIETTYSFRVSNT